jgi:hypothetical protein
MLLAEKPVPVAWHSPSRQAHIDPYVAPERSQCRVSKAGLLPSVFVPAVFQRLLSSHQEVEIRVPNLEA